MLEPKIPLNEQQRLKAVKSYDLLDTPEESAYDNITSIVSKILNVPISLITLLDTNRNFLKSHHGLPFNESPRKISFCGHAILEKNDLFIVEDATKDSRFSDNPLVTEHGAKFYAGIPLLNPEGYPLGTLCAFDVKPKVLNDFEVEALLKLGKQVVHLFELRKKNADLSKAQVLLKMKNENLKHFAGHVSHDMKMPLANIVVSTDILRQKYMDNPKELEYLNYIKKSSLNLSTYINSLLQHYESDQFTLSQRNQSFSVNELLEELIDLLNINDDCIIELPEKDIEIKTKQVALKQIFLNLIGNSLKYSNKETTKITINCSQKDDYVFFEITDNGMGIPREELDSIFELFNTVGNLDKFGQNGHGIGLSTVKKIVESLEGEITVNSTLNEGSTFMFSIKLDD